MRQHDIPPEANVTIGKYFYGYWRDPKTKKLHATYFGKNDPRGTVQETAAALAKGRQG
jgi:hypothetical protein